MAVLASILREEPKPPSGIVEDLPREVERVIQRCLRKDPRRRYQHMDDLKLALEELKEESDSGQLAPQRPAVARPVAVGFPQRAWPSSSQQLAQVSGCGPPTPPHARRRPRRA
jgi:serine/threonine protein kinase